IEGQIFPFAPPPILGISTTGGFEFYLQQRGEASLDALSEMANQFVIAANERPELAGVRTTFVDNTPQYEIRALRDQAYALGVDVSELFSTMQGAFGTRYINDFTLFGRNFQVNMAADTNYRARPDDLENIFVRNREGNMIPLSSLVELTPTTGADLINRFNVFPSAKITGNPAPGYSSGEALKALEDVMASIPGGDDFTIGWTGTAYQEQSSGQAGTIAFVMGLIMVFLILAALYERWSLPFAVVTAVPFAVLGALVAVWLRGLQIDIYFQVGILVLIAIAAKNAILVVEFAARIRQEEGLSIKESALKAARIRFRPVIMTSMAFILGVLPLAIATGAGEAARNSLGTGIIGGMLFTTFLAIMFIPMFFELFQRFSERYFGKKDKKSTAN
ncbi:MAG TPA: hydrophobe/amphiphile efflux-1 family RND transporter, partial [Halothiobacillaceae bacterium]|nr:hydrophobe/amphiphile efflux-1 family RND transporter [Halothiobacillaceae bacterium]